MSLTLKEITDQKHELKTFFENFVINFPSRDIFEEIERKLSDEVLFIGCGSSYNLALTLSRYFERVLKIRAKAFPAGEVAFEKIPEIKGKLAFLFSRTGNTTEVLLANNILRKMSCKTVGITIEEDSKLAKESDFPLVFPIEENAVVMTKSFNMILLSLMFMVDTISGLDVTSYRELVDYSEKFFDLSWKTIEAIDLKRYRHFVFLGMAEFHGISLESALKCIEMSLTFSEAYSTLEYRHGPKALVDENVLIFVQKVSGMDDQEKRLKEELESLGATVLEIGEDGDVPISNEWRSAFLRTIPAQILGYQKAFSSGISPDRPPHLEKTVTL
ncbi:SIS domain-containing protein [Thermotoga sp. SG1]|uniref:SIS domain-containing protein n=1 Tax=Thermotoga sp. SG1 TaxID=126739 RepID=UPI000C766881|nr:SIS domain-containing protein [Thermotoga sp. SG1]PLV56921.1 glutamine--fructose-6-phosphate aminotransferase [Thermotoga sp. SG1]